MLLAPKTKKIPPILMTENQLKTPPSRKMVIVFTAIVS